MSDGSRSQRGEIQITTWAIVAVVAVLAAVPFMLMARHETSSTQEAVDQIDTAKDASAKLLLANAIQNAEVYFAENGSLAGYGPDVARSFDPSAVYTTGPAAKDQVSIRGASATSIVMVTLGGSGPFCAAVNANVVTYGTGRRVVRGAVRRPRLDAVGRSVPPDPSDVRALSFRREAPAMTIAIRHDDEISDVDGGWFRARWHFSFDSYHDPAYVSFGTLRVFNDDRLIPGAIWPMHPHRDIEGLTYVVEGAFRHQDDVGGAPGRCPPARCSG